METNKSILLREVISLGSKKSLGSVWGVLVDGSTRRVGYFLISDDMLNSVSILAWENIFGIGDSFITVYKEELINARGEKGKGIIFDSCRLIGLDVFSSSGDRIGSVDSFGFDNKSGMIEMICLANGSVFDSESIIFVSSSYVFVNADERAKPLREQPAHKLSAGIESMPDSIDEAVSTSPFIETEIYQQGFEDLESPESAVDFGDDDNEDAFEETEADDFAESFDEFAVEESIADFAADEADEVYESVKFDETVEVVVADEVAMADEVAIVDEVVVADEVAMADDVTVADEKLEQQQTEEKSPQRGFEDTWERAGFGESARQESGKTEELPYVFKDKALQQPLSAACEHPVLEISTREAVIKQQTLELDVALDEVERAFAEFGDEEDFSNDDSIFSFLRGAELNDDVISADGTFVVRRGTILTDELLMEAQRHDALVLLTISVDVI